MIWTDIFIKRPVLSVVVSLLILLIGFMMVGWTRRKQGLHDFIAGTLVVRAR